MTGTTYSNQTVEKGNLTGEVACLWKYKRGGFVRNYLGSSGFYWNCCFLSPSDDPLLERKTSIAAGTTTQLRRGSTLEALKLFPLRGKKYYWVCVVTTAVVVGLIVCFEARVLLRSSKASIKDPRFLMVRRALDQGHAIHFMDLTLVRRSRLTGEIPAGALTDQDLPILKGAILKEPRSQGEILTLGGVQLSPAIAGLGSSVPKGKRAYLLDVPNSVQVRIGDKVDVFLSPDNPWELPMALVEETLVLQVAYREDVGQVIVALSSAEIRILEKARQKGKLTLVLRNPEDKAPSRNKSSGKFLKQAIKTPRIEVLSEED